jgi:hypothetical protein
MRKMSNWRLVSPALFLLLSTGLVTGAFAQESPIFTPGNLVVSVEGCGVYGGTCTDIPNGTGNGIGNSSNTGYGDNQASPLTLFQYAPSGVTSATFVNSLQYPQTGSAANLPISSEYGSSSEATLQLDGTGQYLTIMGYGVNANTFNANPTSFGVPGGELAQSGSLTGQSYTPIPRVVTTIDAYGNINSSTANYNVFNENNPRSTYSADGINFYMSGQGTGCDLTGGVFLTTLGTTNDAPTAITGGDALPTSSCVSSGYAGSTVAEDTRTVQIYNGTLYISIDSTEGKSNNRSYIGTLGTPPATSMYVPASGTFPSGYTDGPSQLKGLGNTGGTGKETLTASTANGVNSSGEQVNLSPENYFFASPTVLYLADSGSPKQSSATSAYGAGGLQKWVNVSGTWTWEYTLYLGLNLVANPNAVPANTSGTTGLLGLTGTVVDGVAYLYATNYTIADLDPTYIYGISDTVSATADPGTTFTKLATAPSDSNFKGISFAPSLPNGSATIASVPSGLKVSTSGTGCAPGTYITPVTLTWTPSNTCQLSVVSTQTVSGSEYVFSNWQDSTTATTDSVTAPTTSAVYTATFQTVPVFSPAPGSYYNSASVTISDTTPGASIYYTTNGTTPTTGSTLYSGPVTVSATELLEAIAVAGGSPNSAVTSGIFTILTPAKLTTPTPDTSTPLSGTSVAFTWTAGNVATHYMLYMGNTGPGSSNLYNSGNVTVLTKTVSDLPSNGQTVNARLYSLINGAWTYTDYTYVAYGSPTPAVLTTPAPDTSTPLTGTSVAFSWTPGNVATHFEFYLGTTVGSSNLYGSGSVTATTETVSNLPSNGETLHARLYSLIDGAWQYTDYTYVATGSPVPATLTTPTPNTSTPLTGTSVAFSWTPGNTATQFQFWAGSNGVGSSNLYNSGTVTATTETVSTLPDNDSTVYMRLYSLVNGAWVEKDYTYISAGTATHAALTTPTPNTSTPLTGTSVAFSWSPGNSATHFQLWVGSTGVGSSNLYNSGSVTATTETVSTLPNNDSTVYVRLYSLVNGAWVENDYTYVSAGTATPAAISSVSPVSGTQFLSASETFDWTPGNSATHFMLYLGTSVGSSNLYNSGNVTVTTETVGGLPTNGETIYARLYSLVNGAWQYANYTYTAF